MLINDEVEIIKRQFWNSIKPYEPYTEKVMPDSSIYVSSNLDMPYDYNLKGWNFIGNSNNLIIKCYKHLNYFEFTFEKPNDFFEELFILKQYSILLVHTSKLTDKKFHLFNNNNEFYLFNNKFYLKGFSCNGLTNQTTLLLMTYFVKP